MPRPLRHFLILLFSAVSAVAAVSSAPPDVVIYGGTPSGIAAAITAAREGSGVLVVEPTRHIGGLSTSGLNTAETEHMLKWTIGGFADEFYHRLGRHYQLKDDRRAYEFESAVAEKIYLEMLHEANVRVHFGAHLTSATMEDGRITGITLSDGSSHTATIFIDASYEGDLMAAAGVSHTVGRESRAEFDEPLAGIRFDPEPRDARTVDASGMLLPGISGWKKDYREGDAHPGVMCYNLRLIVTRDPARRVPFPRPKHYDPARYGMLASWLQSAEGRDPSTRLGKLIGLYGRRNGKFEMNNKQSAIVSLGHFGAQIDWPTASYREREMIAADHLDYTLGLLHFLATDPSVPEKIRVETRAFGLHRDEFADNGHLPYQLYVREGRRMRGPTVVRQQDIQTERRKPDSIGMGSHFIDSHHVQRLAVSPDSFINEGRIWRKGHAYQIPYRAITPHAAECTNLLVPVAASFSHVAYCTLRVEGTWMITGHASGVAAAMAAKGKHAVQDVPVAALQEKLRGQGQVVDFIPGMPEKCEQLNGPPEF